MKYKSPVHHGLEVDDAQAQSRHPHNESEVGAEEVECGPEAGKHDGKEEDGGVGREVSDLWEIETGLVIAPVADNNPSIHNHEDDECESDEHVVGCSLDHFQTQPAELLEKDELSLQETRGMVTEVVNDRALRGGLEERHKVVLAALPARHKCMPEDPNDVRLSREHGQSS